MEFWGAIISGLKTLFGALIPSVKKKYFDQPKVYLIFQFNNSSQKAKGISSNNDTSEAIAVPYVIYNFELKWQYDLFLRNNSEHPAYNLRIIKPDTSNRFFLHPKLDSLKPLKENSEIQYSANFSEYFTGIGSEASIKRNEGSPLLSQLILEYTNLKGSKFYTHYDINAEETKRNHFKAAYPKRQIAILILFSILVIFIMVIASWKIFGSNKVDERASLKQDAHAISESIIISGWEDTGDYIGFLSQITGFYSRHKELFPTEYEIYKKQLDNWTDYLNNKRGNALYSYDTEGLKGLVTSGKRHLEQLEK